MQTIRKPLSGGPAQAAAFAARETAAVAPIIHGIRRHLLAHPVVASLRGIRPQKCIRVAEALCEAGVRTLEVPLNSPRALDCIEALAHRLQGRQALVGAGMVLKAAHVDAVADAGARLVLAPRLDVEVVARAADRGLYVMPGVATLTEAFQALAAGAHGLQLFPASVLGPASFEAWLPVLPPGAELFAMDGVNMHNLAAFHAAGACGAGLGSALYAPGLPLDELSSRARAAMALWAQASGTA